MFPPVFLPDKFMQHAVLGYAPLPFDGRDRAEDIVYRRKSRVLERVSVLAEHGRQTRHQDIDLIRQKGINREVGLSAVGRNIQPLAPADR